MHSLMIRFQILATIATVSTVHAQTTDPAAYVRTLREAQVAYDKKDFVHAAPLWAEVARMNPVRGENWARLARSYYMAHEYERSIQAYRKQIELGYGIVPNAAYNIACDFALLGQKDSALVWLKRAIDLKFENLGNARTDEDLVSLRSDPRFKEMVGIIDVSGMTRDEGWRTDLDYLVREIKRRGWNLFPRIGTEATFDKEVASIRSRIPSLSDAQVEIEFMRLLTKLRDGHTGLMGAVRPEFLETLPLQFYLFEEGLFVVGAAPQYRELVGAQVKTFGGKPALQVLDAINAITSADNSYWIKQLGPYRMRHIPLLYAGGVVPDSLRVDLGVRILEGADRVVTVNTDKTHPDIWNMRSGVAGWERLPKTLGATAPLYLRNPDASYWFEYLPESKAMYVQFNLIRDDKNEPIAAFAQRLLTAIENQKPTKLIIDMRHNNGGNAGLLRPFVHAIIRAPNLNRKESLFVMIGRRTFSAAQTAATMFDVETNATFVGEPTGSSANFVGEEDPFVLPYSKVVANVSHLYWQNGGPGDDRTWIAPDLYMPPTFAAYKAGRDPALEAILSLP